MTGGGLVKWQWLIMAEISEKTLVGELAERLDHYSHRQDELLRCLRALREELGALRIETQAPSPARPSPPQPVADASAPVAPSSTVEAGPELAPPPMRALVRTPRLPSRLAPGGPQVGTRPPIRTVGSPGHLPRRDYNYFTELDERLARLAAHGGGTL